jgi:glycosyltransferase involved in cell wall biosynthesis
MPALPSVDDDVVWDVADQEPSPPLGRVTVDGKQFAVNGTRFHFRGVTYGTFRPRDADGARFPERPVMQNDLLGMKDAGFTVVRTYTAPPDDLLELASNHGLRVLGGMFYRDWRYLLGMSGRERRCCLREARAEVARAVRRLAGREVMLGLCVGNEVPADVVRWFGTGAVSRVLADLVAVVRDIDPELLLTYANYPTAEYLSVDSLDFVTFNVFLERRNDLRRYLTRLQHLAGDRRPLVLGELGFDSGGTPEGEIRQAEVLRWQLETALERGLAGGCVFSWTDEWFVGDADVTDWHFGLTRRDRTPRPALSVVARSNGRHVRDLPEVRWPSLSVVICAYNAAPTLDECLEHTCALDYPDLEVLVVDDGSTDETAAIVSRHPRARLVTVSHAGLSAARNAGFSTASGELVAYLDSDAFPSPEWPYYLVLGFDGPNVAGVGGPNIPPASDGPGAQAVAQAPGGPVQVLTSDDRAEHIPGCNMAFFKSVLIEMGGFDPVYTSAGDDVDFCWRVLDSGWEIAFHPAALVWHHRRPGLRSFLRQQGGYGRSEALVEARHPDRFTRAGTARWRGRIYNAALAPAGRQYIYRGTYGTAPYQSVYRGGGHSIDLAHQVGVPVAMIATAVGLAGVLFTPLAIPAVCGLLFLGSLLVIDFFRCRPPTGQGWRFRMTVATMHLLQPLVRAWGRLRHRSPARRSLPSAPNLQGPVGAAGRGVLLVPDPRPRDQIVSVIVSELRRQGMRVESASVWERYDARIVDHLFVEGDLLTSSFPIGVTQVRVCRRLRYARLVFAATVLALIGLVNAWAAAIVAGIFAASVAWAWRDLRTRPRAVIEAAAAGI